MPGLPPVLADVVKVDRSKIAIDVAVRCSFGVGIVLVAGEATGHATQGVTAAVGAINAGFSSFQGAYRTRAAVVLAATLGTSLAAFVAMTAGHVLGADLVITGAIGFVAGLLVALGQPATVVGLQTVVGLLVFNQFSLGAVVALEDALLVVAPWPLRRFPEERRALGAAFGRLSVYAGTLWSDPESLLDAAAFADVDQVLRDPQPIATVLEVTAFQGLGTQAERIRLELAAVARNVQRIREAVGLDGSRRDGAQAMQELLEATRMVLAEVAAALRDGRVPIRWEEERARFEGALARLQSAAQDSVDPLGRITLEGAYSNGEALAGQLRSAVRLAAIPAGGDPQALEEAAVTGRPIRRAGRATIPRDLDWVREQAATLRANLDRRSEAFRHGVRVGSALMVAVALSHFFKQGHRYWLPLTVMLVLKPDFSSTVTRGISRVVGTLTGAGLVTLVIAETKPGHVGLTVMVLAFYLAATALLFANYAIYSVCVASLVVTLLAFTGQPEVSLAGERSFYTVIGAAVAMTAYFLWPTWAATSLPDRLSELFLTEGRYGAEVLSAWSDPSRADLALLQRRRLAARLARTNAEAAVDRSLNEPARRDALPRGALQGVMAAIRSYVQAVLSLHAQLRPDSRPWPDAAVLAGLVDEAFVSASELVLDRSTRARPSLRAAQVELRRHAALDGDGRAEEPDRQAVLIVSETDQIVNAADSLRHHLAGTVDNLPTS